MFKEVFPRNDAEGGLVDESLTTTFKALTPANKLSVGACMICNLSTTVRVLYTLTGASPSGATGLVILPGETLWLWNRQCIEGFMARMETGTGKISVQYFDNSCKE